MALALALERRMENGKDERRETSKNNNKTTIETKVAVGMEWEEEQEQEKVPIFTLNKIECTMYKTSGCIIYM